MDNHELTPFLNELCCLAVTRNAINTRRHRARFRKNYYANAVRVVEAHNMSNYNLRSLRGRLNSLSLDKVDGVMECARLQGQIKAIETSMHHLRQRHPKPVRWQTMGLHKLRSLVLQGEGEYATAKHQTMEFSIEHRSRVKYLLSVLKCSVHYDNGALNLISFKDEDNGGNFDLEMIHHHAEQYELNCAIETIVEGVSDDVVQN